MVARDGSDPAQLGAIRLLNADLPLGSGGCGSCHIYWERIMQKNLEALQQIASRPPAPPPLLKIQSDLKSNERYRKSLPGLNPPVGQLRPIGKALIVLSLHLGHLDYKPFLVEPGR
jgi:hypothetical protein